MSDLNNRFLQPMHDGQSYVVQFTLNCRLYKTMRFKASEYGGMIKAKAAALAWRDQQLAQDPLLGGDASAAEATEETAPLTEVTVDTAAQPQSAAPQDIADETAELAPGTSGPDAEVTAASDEPVNTPAKAPSKSSTKAPKNSKSPKTKEAAEPASGQIDLLADEPDYVDPASLGHEEPELLFEIVEKPSRTIMVKADVEGVSRRVNVATQGWHKAIETAYCRGYKLLNNVDPAESSIPEYAPDSGLIEILESLQQAGQLDANWNPVK